MEDKLINVKLKLHDGDIAVATVDAHIRFECGVDDESLIEQKVEVINKHNVREQIISAVDLNICLVQGRQRKEVDLKIKAVIDNLIWDNIIFDRATNCKYVDENIQI